MLRDKSFWISFVLIFGTILGLTGAAADKHPGVSELHVTEIITISYCGIERGYIVVLSDGTSRGSYTQTGVSVKQEFTAANSVRTPELDVGEICNGVSPL